MDGGGESKVQLDSYTDPSLSNEEEMEGEMCCMVDFHNHTHTNGMKPNKIMTLSTLNFVYI